MILTLPLLGAACGGNTGTGGHGGSGGNTGTGGATTSSTGTGGAATSSSSSGTGGGPAAQCTGIYVESACGTCLEKSCCDVLAQCGADPQCAPCVSYDYDNPACAQGSTKTLVDAVTACAKASCKSQCFATPVTPACDATDPSPTGGSCAAQLDGDCNPVTNDGCAPGDTCVFTSDDNAFHCFGPPHDQMVCEGCTSQDGSCGPGLVCITTTSLGESPNPWTYQSQCAHYCCDDGDCGSGTCDKTVLGSSIIGVCLW